MVTELNIEEINEVNGGSQQSYDVGHAMGEILMVAIIIALL